MAEIAGGELQLDRFISADPANGLLASLNSDATVSNLITRSLATSDVSYFAPTNSTGTNTRRHLFDRPIVSTSTGEFTSLTLSGALSGATTGAFSGNLTVGGAATVAGNLTSSGITLCGTAVAGTAAAGSVVLQDGQRLWATAGAATASVIWRDASAHFAIGGATSTIGDGGVPRISHRANTDLLAAAVAQNGCIYINSTDGRLVFHSNGLRYYVTGTSF